MKTFFKTYVFINVFSRSSPTFFPVKLTEPITAILYITSDKRHMELFKQTLHVKEVAEGIMSLFYLYIYKY